MWGVPWGENKGKEVRRVWQQTHVGHGTGRMGILEEGDVIYYVKPAEPVPTSRAIKRAPLPSEVMG